MFLHLADEQSPDDAHAKAMAALSKARAPGAHAARARRRATSGAIFFIAEFATAVAGWALEINPFDQPNVQEAKDNTARVLDEGAPDLEEGDARASCSTASSRRATWRSWATCPTPTRSRPRSRACARRVIERHGVATTWGYGPRFLHSTGQFHKGGPPTGRFLQLVDDSGEDLEIPGEPSASAR